MKYNIAIIPSDDICQKAISISRELYQKGGEFKLEYDTNFTHVTVAHFECFDTKILDNITNEFELQIADMQAFNINQYKYRLNYGWLDVSFELNDKLLFVYKTVFDILQKNNCKKTSDDWDDNLPHITFTKFSSNEDFDIKTLSKQDFSFIVDRIGIFELGDYGTNKKLLKSFDLQEL